MEPVHSYQRQLIILFHPLPSVNTTPDLLRYMILGKLKLQKDHQNRSSELLYLDQDLHKTIISIYEPWAITHPQST